MSEPHFDFLHACFTYDPGSGELLWKMRPHYHFTTIRSWRTSNSRFAGKEAGIITSYGYRYVRFADREQSFAIMAHRICWAMHYGAWPKHFIDHINRNKLDNRIANLRDATQSQNAVNTPVSPRNKVGLKGASPWGNKFKSQIQHGGKVHYLGLFETAELAHQAYREAAVRFHGDFARFEP